MIIYNIGQAQKRNTDKISSYGSVYEKKQLSSEKTGGYDYILNGKINYITTPSPITNKKGLVETQTNRQLNKDFISEEQPETEYTYGTRNLLKKRDDYYTFEVGGMYLMNENFNFFANFRYKFNEKSIFIEGTPTMTQWNYNNLQYLRFYGISTNILYSPFNYIKIYFMDVAFGASLLGGYTQIIPNKKAQDILFHNATNYFDGGIGAILTTNFFIYKNLFFIIRYQVNYMFVAQKVNNIFSVGFSYKLYK